MLNWAQLAARRLEDRQAEAWCLHQRGSYALGQGEPEAAQKLLRRALQLRQTMGDTAGSALTRHNLALSDDLLTSSLEPFKRGTWYDVRGRLTPLASGMGAFFRRRPR